MSADAPGRPGPGGGPLPPLLGWAGVLAEPVYRWVIAGRNRRFDRGEGVRRLPVGVISVGNLSVGGSGKTPMVAWLARALLARGARPAIALRGYRGGAHGEHSDEADEYRRLLPEAPLAVGPDRFEQATRLIESRARTPGDEGAGGGGGGVEGAGGGGVEGKPGPITHILLDDGFQHRRLHRDVDLVLIDATRDPFSDHLLPRGWLREPVESLRRAHAVAITHAEAVDAQRVAALAARVRGVLGGQRPIAVCRHAWVGIEGLPDGPAPTEWLSGRRVYAACAIGNPGPFLAELGRRAALAGALVLPDHDAFAATTVARLRAEAIGARAEAIVVTEKDWSKLRRTAGDGGSGGSGVWPCPVVRPRLELQFDTGGDALLELAAGAGQSEMGEPSR